MYYHSINTYIRLSLAHWCTEYWLSLFWVFHSNTWFSRQWSVEPEPSLCFVYSFWGCIQHLARVVIKPKNAISAVYVLVYYFAQLNIWEPTHRTNKTNNELIAQFLKYAQFYLIEWNIKISKHRTSLLNMLLQRYTQINNQSNDSVHFFVVKSYVYICTSYRYSSQGIRCFC